MPVGRLTREQYEAEMGSARTQRPRNMNEPHVEIESHPAHGKPQGKENIPESLRRILGETSVIEGRAEALKLASEFDVSPSSVSAYANNATSTATYNTPSQSLLAHINKSRYRAIKRAGNTLNAALGAISQEKLDYTDAKDLSTIAKNMSAVIKDLTPPKETPEGTNVEPKFVIFAPQFRKEEAFEVIDVKE